MRVDGATIISRLGGNSHSGMCKCPAHDDGTASLHVSQGANGKVLLKCHAGCPQQAVISALRSRGLWGNAATTIVRGLGGPDPSRKASEEEPPELKEYHAFRQAYAILRAALHAKDKPDNQSLLSRYLKGRGLEVVPPGAMLLPVAKARKLTGYGYPAMVLPIINGVGRLQGAHVTFLTRDGSRNLRSKEKKTSFRRIYGKLKGGFAQLGELDPDKPLCMAEGIEDALSVSRISGYPAIAALSANNLAVIPPPCSELIVAGDNDEAGRRYAKTTAERLTGPGRLVRIAIPKQVKDWNEALQDAVANGSDLAELRRSIVRAKQFKGSGLSEVRALTLAEFMALEVPPQEYLVKPWLRTGSIAMVHAQRGNGKTWLTLSTAFAVMTGETSLPWSVERKGRVLYVDGELPTSMLQKDWLSNFPASDNLWIVNPDMFYHRGEQMFDLGEEAGRAFLDGIIERHKIDLIILDSLSTLVRTGIENEAESWSPLQTWAMKHRFRGRSLIFVHHEGAQQQTARHVEA